MPDKNKKPIVVPTKNDPRYRAYQDSVKVFNYGLKMRNILKNAEDSDDYVRQMNKGKKFSNGYVEDYGKPKDVYESIQRLKSLNGKEPENIGTFSRDFTTLGITTAVGSTPLYKKPQQPVIVQDNKPKTLEEFKKKYPNAQRRLVRDDNGAENWATDPQAQYTSFINYPKKETKPLLQKPTIQKLRDTPQVTPLQPMSVGLKNTNSELQPNLNIPIPAKPSPTSYEVVDTNNQRFGGGETKYSVDKLDSLRELPKEQWERKVTPVYKNKLGYGAKLAEGGNIPLTEILSGALPIGASLISGLTHMNDAEKARSLMLNNIIQQKRTTDGQALADYKPQGNAGVQYYAGGGKVKPLSNIPTKGKFNTTGGDLVPISNSAEVAEGNEHGETKIDGQSGIMLHDGNKPIAEIEDKEVIVDNEQVFSDRLKYDNKNTFADIANKLQTKAGKLEEKLEHTTDSKNHAGLERMLKGIQISTDNLFNKQEIMKQVTGKSNTNAVVPKAALGMRLPGSGYNTLPSSKQSDRPKDEEEPQGNKMWDSLKPNLIDNGVNAILTATSPKLVKPILATPAQMKTTINVNPQLSEIANNVAGTTDNIMRNTSDANTARNNIASSRLAGLTSKLGVLGQKENIETQLKNQDASQRNAVANANIDKTNEYANLNFTRANDIASRISGNVADVSKNIKDAQTTKEMQDYYDEDMLLSLLDDKTGDKARVMSRNPYFAKNPRLAKAVQNEVMRKATYVPYSFKSQVSNTLFNK